MEGSFKQISALVDGWLELHKGETFDLDLICRQLDIQKPENRHEVVKKLSYEVKRGNLEKSNRLYKVIDNTIKYINDWIDTSTDDILTNFKWPCSHQDATEFDFEGHILLPAGALIVLAGVSNMGKTAICHNIVAENADKYHITMMINEANKAKFKRRFSKLMWFDPLDGDGKPKFDLIERHGDWKYAVQKDDINIIDWIDMPEGDYYKISAVLDGIKSKLQKGLRW